jgi:hypothetical protein
MGARQHRPHDLQDFLQEIRQGEGRAVGRTDKYNYKNIGKAGKWLKAHGGRIVVSLHSLSQLHGFVNIVINVPIVPNPCLYQNMLLAQEVYVRLIFDSF